MPATIDPAVLYVQQHMSILTAYSRSRRFRPHFVDPDEFMADLVITVMTGLPTFRRINGNAHCPHCGGEGCATWLGWRARGAATKALHLAKRERERIASSVPIEEAEGLPASHGSAYSIQMLSVVSQVLRTAKPEQRECALTVLNEMTGPEVEHHLGYSLAGRNYHLRKLRDELRAN